MLRERAGESFPEDSRHACRSCRPVGNGTSSHKPRSFPCSAGPTMAPKTHSHSKTSFHSLNSMASVAFIYASLLKGNDESPLADPPKLHHTAAVQCISITSAPFHFHSQPPPPYEVFFSLDIFNDHGNSLPPADASCAYAILHAFATKLMREVRHNATSRCTERVSQCYSTPVRVGLGAI